ncbi:LysR family transcriptional regulator [Aquisediminimonas profunda]|uniref:LysR family transcriptional regulator n=1 Tax=Aquisediminimonas profunda TaxID=1550733 RepID=UPI001C62E570|nr:LysR family transcriptional regulator [Aquisediminimonas profunda]
MPSKRLPNLGSLRVFEAAARKRSFVAAAVELNVTHGAISKQVQALERELGTKLFERRNRGIFLTPQGHWLAGRLAIVFGELSRTMDTFLANASTAAPLTVSCESTLCLRFLIPALTSLKHETDLDIRVFAAGGPIDFRPGYVDVAVRRDDFEIPPGVRATWLADEWMGPVMNPLIVNKGVQTIPRLHSESRPNAWGNWELTTGIKYAGTDILYEHFFLAIQAAEAGQGIALASIHMVANELEAGRLIAPNGFTRDGSNYVALRPAGTDDERVDAFLDWFQLRLGSNVKDGLCHSNSTTP